MGKISVFGRIGLYLTTHVGQMKKMEKLVKEGRVEEKNKILAQLEDELCEKTCRWAGVTIAVEGEENLPDETAVFVANHQSFFDALVMLKLTAACRPCGFVMKKEFEKIPLVKSWCSLLDCVFIDRDNPREGVKGLTQASDNLKNGISMVVFPEGTRTKNYPVMGEFKNGAFKIAQKNKNPIVPIVIFDAGARNEAAGKMTGGTIHVRILPPLHTNTMDRSEYKTIAQTVHDKIEAEMREFHAN